MTNTNISWNGKGNLPFLLKPVGKDYLWGGSRLNDDFAKGISMTPLAETWECSTHPDGECLVATGAHRGNTLTQVLNEHPEYWGEHPLERENFPILIKLIDADKDLSIQVHPDDAYAMEHEHGQLGKTEMWYVLDALPNARLIYGFSHAITKEALHQSIVDGTVERHLQRVPVQKGDVFFIEAGTVHAIGKGVMVAEIQENSNLTYRLFDYHRPDKNGKMRPLHIEKALDVVNLKASDRPRQPIHVLKYHPGFATEFLCRCAYFQIERMLLNTEICREMAQMSTYHNSFQVLLCVDGCGVIQAPGGNGLPFFKGDCIFVPANSAQLFLHGRAELLRVSC